MKQWLIRKGREARGGEIDWDAILTDYIIAKKPRTDTFIYMQCTNHVDYPYLLFINLLFSNQLEEKVKELWFVSVCLLLWWHYSHQGQPQAARVTLLNIELDDTEWRTAPTRQGELVSARCRFEFLNEGLPWTSLRAVPLFPSFDFLSSWDELL